MKRRPGAGASRRRGSALRLWRVGGVMVMGLGTVPADSFGVTTLPGPGLAAADSGFVIRSDVVVRNCGACHTPDESGRMGRLSYMRKTPEGWQNSIRRMVSLHGVQIEPQAARAVVKYLSDTQGLAPEELEPGRFEVERRMQPFRYSDESTERTCSACHSMGRIITQRRTAEEWDLLITTHRALYPLVDRQAFYTGSGGNEGGESRAAPVERAVEHLAEEFPLLTPEWSSWSANVRPPRIGGTWALSGVEPGKGRIYGSVEVVPAAGSADEFTTRMRYEYVEDGATVEATGTGLVYTGYQWRGRSQHPGGAGELREVLTIERGWEEIEGRWFTGAYDEIGIDVTLRRAGMAPVISGVHPASLRAGVSQEVRVYGMGLPTDLAASALDFGPDVRVREIVRSSPEVLVARVEVSAGAQRGRRDVFVGAISLTNAVVVYENVEGVRVRPELGLARVGGTVVPKQLQQFEAIGLDYGADRQPGTDDDVEIGVVPAEWAIEEYPVTYEDDDVRFVGSIDADGLFTPATDGPNPDRSGNRNNIGEVWVVARYQGPDGPAAEGRAYLIVTAPLHLRWGEGGSQ